MPKKILLVDDSATFREVVSKALVDAGYEVAQAENGKDALNKLCESTPDLIVSDVNMPEMNGIQFVEKVKENQDFRFIPIMMLTTEGSEQIKTRGKELGVRAWMIKPFKAETLLNAVTKLVP